MSVCMLAAALLFSSGFSYSVLAEEGTEPTTKLTTEPTTEPITEPTNEPITEPTTEPITEPTTEPSTEPVTEPTTEPDTAVTDVQNLINALPTAETLATMSAEEQQAAREKLDSVQQAYMALSDEQKGQVTGTEIFDRLYEFFNKAKNEAPASDDTLTQETQTTEGETEKVTCTCETACTVDTVNTDCPVCSADSAQCTGTMPEANTVLLGNEPDTTVINVQNLIDTLPTAEELKAMPSEEQQAVYTQLCEVYEAYEALSDEQKAQVTGAEIFDALFAVFNGMTEPLEDRIITGGTYSNSDFADMKSGETLKITGGVTQFTDSINLPSGVSLEITGGIVNVNGDIDADSIVIDGSAVVFCNSLLGTQEPLGNCILFTMGTAIGVAYGQVSLPDGVTIPSGCMLWIGSSESVTIPEGVTLTNNGTINNTGTLTVKGDVNGNGTLTGNGTVNKKDQTAVNFTMERLERTDSRITILTESGQKYAVSVSNLPPDKDAAETWKDGTGTTVSFTGLNPDSPYWLYTYKPGNAYYNDSAVISMQFYTRELGPEAPTASEVTINYKAETITFDDTLEVNTSENFDGTYISNKGFITDYIKDTENTIYVRAKQQGNISASAATPVTIPARPAAPDSKYIDYRNGTTYVQIYYDGKETVEFQYKINDGTFTEWRGSTSPVTSMFLVDNLHTSDVVTFQVRKAASDTEKKFASEALTLNNFKPSEPVYEITIPKTVQVGDTDYIKTGSMMLGYEGLVTVSIADSCLESDGTITLTRENDPSNETISVQMKANGSTVSKDVCTFDNWTSPSTSIPICFEVVAPDEIPAGTYSRTVTFELTYSETGGRTSL